MTVLEFWLLGVAVIVLVAAIPWVAAGIAAIFTADEVDDEVAVEITGTWFFRGHLIGPVVGGIVLTLGILLH